MSKKLVLLLMLSFTTLPLWCVLVPYTALSYGPEATFSDSEVWLSQALAVEASALSFSTGGVEYSLPLSFSYVFPSQNKGGLRLPEHFAISLEGKIGYGWKKASLAAFISMGYEGYPAMRGGILDYGLGLEGIFSLTRSIGIGGRAKATLRSMDYSLSGDLIFRARGWFE